MIYFYLTLWILAGMSLHEYLLVLDLAFETMKKGGCFLTKHSLRNMNQLRMSQGRISKIPSSPGGMETVVWNMCSYQVPEIVVINASKN